MRIAEPMRANALLFALMGALLVYVWRVQDLFPVLATAKLLTVISLAVPAIIVLDRRAQRQLGALLRRPLPRLLIALAVMGALSVPTSLWPGMSFDFLTKNLLPAIVLSLAVMGAVSSLADVRRFVWIQVLGATLYAEVILTRFDIGPDGRLGNLVFYDANDLGMLLVCTIPFIVYLLRHTRSLVLRALVLGSLVLCLLTIVKTGSRGAFLALVAMSLYLLFRFSTVHVSTRLITVGVVAAALVTGAGDSYWKAMGTLLKPQEDYNWVGGQSGGRMEVWSRGIGYMTSRPVTGVGLGAFPMAEGTISPLAAQQSFGHGLKWSAAHNSFVQVGAELGVPGLLIFASILWMTFRMAGRLARDALARAPAEPGTAGLASASAAALIGFAVGGFFLSQAYAPYLYFVVGSVVGLDAVVRARWRSGAPRMSAIERTPRIPRRTLGVTRAVAMQRAR